MNDGIYNPIFVIQYWAPGRIPVPPPSQASSTFDYWGILALNQNGGRMKDNKPYIRERGSDSRYSTEQVGVTEWNCPPSADTTLAWSGQPGGTVGAMIDTVVPNYKALIANGAVINNPMSKWETEFVFPPHGFVDRLTYPIASDGCIISTYSGETGAVTELLGSADAKLVQDFGLAPGLSEEILIHSAGVKARNRVSPVYFQSIVSLVELPKTVNLLTNTFKSVAYMVRGVKRGNWSDIKRAFSGRKTKLRNHRDFAKQTATQRWLELRYGWTPLMLEAQGLLAAMSRPPDLKVRQVARGFEKSELHTEVTKVLDYGSYGKETFRFDITRSSNARAYILYEVALKGLQPLRDFGIVDLPQAAWELVPYSFVVDWFIPIGNWLEAISPKLGIHTLAEGYTIETQYRVNRTVVSHTPPTVGAQRWTRTGSVGRIDSYRHDTKRRVTSLEVVTNFPPLNVKINVKRMLDAVALITGQSSRGTTIRS